MAQYEHLPIYKKAYDLSVYFEKTVKHFSRYNKYTLGKDLRDNSRQAVKIIIRANSSWDKLPFLYELRLVLEELKVTLRICKEMKVFNNFDSFRVAINHVIDISKQNEGWIRKLSEKDTD